MVDKDSVYLLRQDLISHSKTITSLVEKLVSIEGEIIEFRIDRARRDEQTETMKREFSIIHDKIDKEMESIHDKIDREAATSKKNFDSLMNTGKWILSTFMLTFIAAAANFIIKGGLNVPVP